MRRLAFAPNYGYEDKGHKISSIIFELEGSPSKGTIIASASYFGARDSSFSAIDFSKLNNKITVETNLPVNFVVRYVGEPMVQFSKEDQLEVAHAVSVFALFAGIQFEVEYKDNNDIKPHSNDFSLNAYTFFTKLNRE